VSWFANDKPINLEAQFLNPQRYLDITEILTKAGAGIEIREQTLALQLPLQQITGIRMGNQPWGKRLVLDLEQPTFWQVSQAKEEGIVTVQGVANPTLLAQFQPLPIPSPKPSQDEDDLGGATNTPVAEQLFSLDSQGTTTQIKIKLPPSQGLRVSSLDNPPRLIIDIRPDYLLEREIVWSRGVVWKQFGVSLGAEVFPIHILELDPTQVSLRALSSKPGSLIGIAPLVQIGREQGAIAAINGGFFNRQTQLPLGAIREGGRWLSSPILNRGAIAWNAQNKWRLGRLSWQETLQTAAGQSYRLVSFNSGYLEAGMARYTRDWGANYTTLSDGEIVLRVENNQISQASRTNTAGKDTLPIPANGYLLVIRKNAVTPLPTGTKVSLSSSSIPPDFSDYPEILSAGPLLIENGQIVLDVAAEKFNPAFQTQKASRSAIALTPQGKILLIALHQRLGGSGADLSEFAEIVKSLGVKDALNLDGGSSTSLFLGGQLVDRYPVTAAKIHNGIGVFINSK
jgi:hypothetical protein